MLTKLLSLLAQAKGAAIATVIVAGAATTTVVATNTDIGTAIQNVTNTVGTTLGVTTANTSADRSCADDGGGQPAVVAQRNAAEKLLRDAFQNDQKALEDLRGGKNTDSKAVGDVVKKYDDQLRATLDGALVDVSRLTLGRDGQVRKADASGSAKPAGSSGASRSPRPSESPEASESPKPSCSPRPSSSGAAASSSPKPSDAGRVAVAERTTLDADVQAIVTTAVAKMDGIVKAATAEAAAAPSPDHGKPSDNPGGANKPDGSSKPEGGKPSENPGGGNRPSASPGRP